MEIGDIVQFIHPAQNTRTFCGLTPEMEIIAENGFFGKVEQVVDNKITVKCLSELGGLSFASYWFKDDLMLFSLGLEQAQNMQRCLDDDYIEGKGPSVKITEEVPRIRMNHEEYLAYITPLISLPAERFEDIDYYSRPKKPKMIISHFFVQEGNLIEGKFRKHSRREVVEECCQLFTTNRACNDLIVEIPVDWCTYMGYSEGVVREWVGFINELNFPVTLDYKGTNASREHEEVKMREGGYLIHNNAYHTILIPCTEYNALNYIALILVRYLFHTAYNNIPGICLQIKKQTNLSNWKILMLAHCLNRYDSYYGLVLAIQHNKFSIKIPDISERSNLEAAYLKRLNKTGSPNKAFKYTLVNRPYYEQLIEIIKQKQYSKLESWVGGINQNSEQIKETVIPSYPKRKLTTSTPDGAVSFILSEQGISIVSYPADSEPLPIPTTVQLGGQMLTDTDINTTNNTF